MKEDTEYQPVSVLTSTGQIKFTISAENSNYIDFANTFLYVRASATAANGANLSAGTEIVPECTFYTRCGRKLMLILTDSLSLSPTITVPIVRTSKTLVNKKILALNVRSILGYIEVAEPKYALSFLELALVFEIWSVENFHEQFLRTKNK